ncbi:relaxase/mobilization nuclease domain-containing protein [Paracnuella aquatica]|uniref:relaxase/mobilization nuclease domain-containing protein n=1 Tax=Paracnuella aquatica TaxID=2268757 RepID=UPI000DEF7937|nr:relaxase/mobilization nuclease domain-containing protein [Paracnuella aquatica]RPD44011.1 relaxase [Paracnuella aquatica]
MVAVIKTGTSIHRALNYNEQKVKQGVAECIAAVNYPKDVSQLTLSNKLNRLLKQAALNENVTRNSVHISLNFDPSEKHLSDVQLSEIADAYMTKIGFAGQPYLVYQHHDAGHPHIHLVTVKVRPDGSRIDTQNIGQNQSQKVRKEIEQAFGLVKADEHKQRQAYELEPVNAVKVQYGKSETKRAIAGVLQHVLNNYKYTSLPELNAVLQPYNVVADNGNEGSRIYKNGGLVYRIMDAEGKKIGVPIKASDFYNKPTLKHLQQRYAQNEVARQPHKARVKNAIDLALLKNPKHTLQSLVNTLEKDGIHTAVRQNDQGLIYGVTYIDHRTKTVFNGSNLGKAYSAKGLQERCSKTEGLALNVRLHHTADKRPEMDKQTGESGQKLYTEQDNSINIPKAVNELLQPEQTTGYVPHQLKSTKKKKRKRISHHP